MEFHMGIALLTLTALTEHLLGLQERLRTRSQAGTLRRPPGLPATAHPHQQAYRIRFSAPRGRRSMPPQPGCAPRTSTPHARSSAGAATPQSVRIFRPAAFTENETRMAISGRMADVCAALERLAASERA
jgi:hypothetical protein